ncbi:collagen-like triple helix repeat-containing protein [Puia sp. P3]|uniref:collagen-like triple helix repeat-containing protein n=1 Tax=Puia sp. P3 TaxID=3423952 RepID=UPI003D6761AD
MQKTSARLFIATATLLIVSLISCKKGDTGPAGPAGPTGATGAPGPTGPQGNANVMVDTFTVKNADWLWNSAYILSTGTGAFTEYFTRYHDQAFTKITKDVLASGMVLAYFAPYTDSVNGWVPVPYTFLSFGAQYYVNIVFVPTTGSGAAALFLYRQRPDRNSAQQSVYRRDPVLPVQGRCRHRDRGHRHTTARRRRQQL